MTNVCAFCYTNDASAEETGVCKDCIPSTHFSSRYGRAITVNKWLSLRVDIAKRSGDLFKGHYVVYLPEQGAEAMTCRVPDKILVTDSNWLNKELIESVTCKKCKIKLKEFDKMYKEQGMR